MNERIKELAIQARLRSPLILQYWGKIEALTDSEQEELENIEKFAELIVKECAEQVKNLRVNDYGISGAEIIREHFGVEE